MHDARGQCGAASRQGPCGRVERLLGSQSATYFSRRLHRKPRTWALCEENSTEALRASVPLAATVAPSDGAQSADDLFSTN